MCSFRLGLSKWFAAWLALGAAVARAEPRVVSLPEAIAHARAHQPNVLAALERVRAQQQRAAVPSAGWMPTFGATAQIFAATANNTTGTYNGVSSVDLPRIGGTRSSATGSLRPYPSTLVAIGANQQLYDFGRIAAQTAVEDALVDVQRQRSRGVLLDVTFNVEEAYFAVLAAHAIVTAAEGAYERARVHRDLAQAAVRSELRPPIEATRAEADLASFDVAREQARGNLALAQAAFAAACGAPDAALDAAPAPVSAPDLPALTDAMRRASAADPRLAALWAELRAEEQRARAIAAERYPDLALTATFSGRAGGAQPSNGTIPAGGGWLPRVPNWDIGVVFSWPLFDGVIEARVDAARAAAQARRAELASARFEQAAAIRASYLEVSMAKAALPGLQRARDAAQANYAQAEARFRAGLGSGVELADAQNVRAQAEVRLALGEFQMARTRAAFGRLLSEGM